MIDAMSLDTTERAVLASALRNADVREQLVAHATPDWFVAIQHRTVFAALTEVVRRHQPIDVPTLIAEARKGAASIADTPLEIEWLRESWKLADTVTPESVEKTHLPELRRAYQTRALQALSGALLERCESAEPGEVASWLQARAEAIMASHDAPPIVNDAEVLMSIKGATSERDFGPLTGIVELDRDEFRLTPRKVTVLVARAGHGKSAVARQWAIGAASQGVGVVYIAAEEGVRGWQETRVQTLTGESIIRLATRTGSPEAFEIYSAYVSDAYERALYVVDNVPFLTAYDVVAEVRRHKKHDGSVGVVIVDQMQSLVGWSDAKRGEGRDLAPKRIIDEIVRGCKELDVHTVLVQQLTQDIDRGHKREPRAGDLADTKFFNDVADAVLTVWRENYDPDDSNAEAIDDTALLKFLKRRGAKKTRRIVGWNGARTIVGGFVDPILAKIQNDMRLRGTPMPFGER